MADVRPLSAAREELNAEALTNFSVLLDAAKRAFAAGDHATADSKCRAAIAVVRRVMSR